MPDNSTPGVSERKKALRANLREAAKSEPNELFRCMVKFYEEKGEFPYAEVVFSGDLVDLGIPLEIILEEGASYLKQDTLVGRSVTALFRPVASSGEIGRNEKAFITYLESLRNRKQSIPPPFLDYLFDNIFYYSIPAARLLSSVWSCSPEEQGEIIKKLDDLQAIKYPNRLGKVSDAEHAHALESAEIALVAILESGQPWCPAFVKYYLDHSPLDRTPQLRELLGEDLTQK